MTYDEMIEVIQARKEGKTIEWMDKNDKNNWFTMIDSLYYHMFNFEDRKYRVKKEPREWWVNIYSSGEGRMHKSKAVANAITGGMKLESFIECVHLKEVLHETR